MAKEIKVTNYDDMRQSLADATAYERRQQVDLRGIPAPPKRMKPGEIRDLRLRLHASQVMFANFLCVSPKTVQSWSKEFGSRERRRFAVST